MADMSYRNLGTSGLKVSVVGLGCNNFGMRIDEGAAAKVVDAAIELGVNFFDSADIYGSGQSEKFLGSALKGKRDGVLIATKFAGPMGAGPNDRGGSRGWIRREVENSLSRLDTDWIDLYQMHMPDITTPIEETLSALDDLVREGKVRYIGCSNFTGWQVADAAWTARVNHLTPFVSAQNNYSLLERNVEREVVPACEKFGLGVLPYFPLASGMLTGKYRRGESAPQGTRLAGPMGGRALTDSNFDKVEALEKVAAERGVTILHLAIGGLAAQAPVSSVIAGATSPEQIKANVEAGAWVPTQEDMAAINAVVPTLHPIRRFGF
jgi:aryl-alcohol dehydrogenase-like predicted oxidoreductase